MREFEALPPQEIAPWFKSLTDEWLGRISGLFDKTPQVRKAKMRIYLRWRIGLVLVCDHTSFVLASSSQVGAGTFEVFLLSESKRWSLLSTQEQLRWRLVHWLEEGSKVVEPLLPEVALPVLVLAGSEDHVLPSVDEAGRLYDIIPTCQQVCSGSCYRYSLSLVHTWMR